MSTYLAWLLWGAVNVYLGSAMVWGAYRLGYKSGEEQGRRGAVLDALGGGDKKKMKVEKRVGSCVACGNSGGVTQHKGRSCSKCDALSGEHIHLECANCGYKWLVQP